MTGPGCMRVGALLDRGVPQLDPAERLLVEDHLERCSACAEHAAMVQTLRSVLDAADETLTSSARQRVIARALRTADAAPPTALPRPWRPIALAAAAVAIVAGAWLWSSPDGTETSARVGLARAPVIEQPDDPPAADAPAIRTLSGDVELTDAQARAAAGAVLAVDASHVTVLESAILRWNRETKTLTLAQGAVRVEVTPGQQRPFRVATGSFTVEVLGTRFDISAERVTVHRGRVRVVSPSGDVLAELGPDASWPAPDAPGNRPTKTAAQPGALIGQARRTLAARDPQGARTLLLRALAMPLDTAREAEARSLLAECALLEGDDAAAARHYDKVARDHGGTLAGEAALFAQARAEMAAGKTNAARATLRRYLGRYPDGRFAKEARTRLERLGDE